LNNKNNQTENSITLPIFYLMAGLVDSTLNDVVSKFLMTFSFYPKKIDLYYSTVIHNWKLSHTCGEI
jgi:hypothetical protein